MNIKRNIIFALESRKKNGVPIVENVPIRMRVIFASQRWKSHSTLTLLATQDLPTFLYYMIDPLKSWCWGAILFYPFKNSRFS
ncbi:hypothetical protein [Phocaeicola vulgatus]|uniref:hypothetical protein n=1 Tax=Phocaeicola vulgatus TaxID=821 RepID=UPI00155EED1A|nr:hypothetical protein [Phocaeicola vulgatus]